jgi:hypothetical protein
MECVDVAVFLLNCEDVIVAFVLFALQKVLAEKQPHLIYFVYFIVLSLENSFLGLLHLECFISIIHAKAFPSFLFCRFKKLLLCFSFFVMLFSSSAYFYFLYHIYELFCHLFVIFFGFHN